MYQDRKEINSLRCLSDASSAASRCVCLCIRERDTVEIERERREMLSSMSYGMKPRPFVCWSSKVKLCESFQTGHNTVHLPEHISSAFYYQEISLSCSQSLSRCRGPIFYCILWKQITTVELLVWKNSLHVWENSGGYFHLFFSIIQLNCDLKVRIYKKIILLLYY